MTSDEPPVTESVFDRGGLALDRNTVAVKTYRHGLASYRTRPEAKGLGPRRTPLFTTYLRPARTTPSPRALNHARRQEANLLEEIAAGLISDEDETLVEYSDLDRDPFHRRVLPVLREIPARRISQATGLAETTVKRIRSGRVGLV